MPNMLFDGVFEGGGVKGIALVGALKRLEEEGVVLGRVAGTSAGAITASLVAAGYLVGELKDIVWNKDFNDFADMRSLFRQGLGRFFLSKNAFRLWSVFCRWGGYGLFSTEAFYAWMKGLLKEKGVTDFRSVKTYLRVFAVDIVHQTLVRYDKDATPDMEVAEAVRQSMSLPLFFRGRFFNKGSFIVDGGILANYPIDTFNDQGGLATTIGLKLISEEQTLAPKVPANIFAYLLRIFETMQVAHERVHVQEAKWARTIPIPTGKISTIDFDLAETDKTFLWDSGYAAAEKAIKEGLLTPLGRA
ncbi:MAG TPA: patatin-like phospholipase family protein [Candidatus Omnitrophota bacterium]|nr:patatin-like phospholipase family protein [Candidatus Omnitrophota bacterium]HPN55744.1 patatin-like phospholipase family protein [Candidatus Omnitrophota bacterium]